jgi:hypothetical protein
VRKHYHTPATPCDRLLADPRTSAIVRKRVEALRADLDPVHLLGEMRAGQQAHVAMAARTAPVSKLVTLEPEIPVPIATFLARLRTAWQSGEGRPTAQAKPKQNRGAAGLTRWWRSPKSYRAWFKADTSRTRASCSCSCRPLTPVAIPMRFFARCSAALRPSEENWQAHWCSAPRTGRHHQRPSSRQHMREATSNALGSIPERGNTPSHLIVALHSIPESEAGAAGG